MVEKKERKRREHPLFDYAYEDNVTFECPVRGTVTQRVLVKRYKSQMQARREAMLRSRESELEEMLDGGYHLEDNGTEEYEAEE